MVVSKDISKELAQDEEVRRRAKRNKKKPKSLQQKIVFGIVFAFFIVYAIYILTPFAYGFLISLKKNGRAFMNEDIFVNLRYFDNYAKAIKSLTLNDINYFSMLFNSIWYAVGTTVVSTASTIVTGYIFAKYEFLTDFVNCLCRYNIVELSVLISDSGTEIVRKEDLEIIETTKDEFLNKLFISLKDELNNQFNYCFPTALFMIK